MFDNGPRSNMRRYNGFTSNMRRYNGFTSRMPLFFKIWFAIVFAGVAATFAITMILAVSIIYDPESLGVFVGRIVHGFNTVQ